MRILYIFPHPDDESFGPAPGIVQQRRQGHEVFLLTLTKGGATKVRHDFNYSVNEMGDVRFQEMLCVEKTLDLSGMTVLDLPDSGLSEMDPALIEAEIESHILKIKPDILVTYAVHGVSGFHDHLVTHAVVKSVFCRMRGKRPEAARRLALFTLGPESDKESPFNLQGSPAEKIDCILKVSEEESVPSRAALDCYKTYEKVIQKTKIKERVGEDIHYEFFQEELHPPVNDVTAGIK